MADSGDIKELVNEAAVQAAVAVMMVFTDTDTRSYPATTPSQWQTQRWRHWGLILEKSKFNWDTGQVC